MTLQTEDVAAVVAPGQQIGGVWHCEDEHDGRWEGYTGHRRDMMGDRRDTMGDGRDMMGDGRDMTGDGRDVVAVRAEALQSCLFSSFWLSPQGTVTGTGVFVAGEQTLERLLLFCAHRDVNTVPSTTLMLFLNYFLLSKYAACFKYRMH